MQKKIIALAVVAAAASAPAFADPTVYGLLDAAVVSISNTGQKSQTLGVSGGLATSRLGFKGAEDIGGGTKVVYQYEVALDDQSSTANGGGLAGTARQELLGIAGDFGTVASGYLQTTAWDFGVKFDPTGGSKVSPLGNLSVGGGFVIGDVAAGARASRALAYISPNLSGFTVAVNYSTAFAGNSNLGNLTLASGVADQNVTATLVSANYDAGPLAAAIVYAGTSNPAANSNVTEWALGGTYDLGVAKLYGTYQNSSTNAAASPQSNSNKLYSISALIPAGSGNVAVSYAHAKIDTAAAGVDGDGTSYTAAYLYGLSKTATVYAAYSRTTNGSGTNSFAGDNSLAGIAGGTSSLGASSNVIALGLKKNF